MIRNIDLDHYHEEKCISCGVIFEQWIDSHHEHCPSCRLAIALETIADKLQWGQI